MRTLQVEWTMALFSTAPPPKKKKHTLTHTTHSLAHIFPTSQTLVSAMGGGPRGSGFRHLVIGWFGWANEVQLFPTEMCFSHENRSLRTHTHTHTHTHTNIHYSAFMQIIYISGWYLKLTHTHTHTHGLIKYYECMICLGETPFKFYYINRNASSSVVSNWTQTLDSGPTCPEFKGSVTFSHHRVIFSWKSLW